MIRAFGLPHFGQTSRWGLGTLETALRLFKRRLGSDSLMVVPFIIAGSAGGCTFNSAHVVAVSRGADC